MVRLVKDDEELLAGRLDEFRHRPQAVAYGNGDGLECPDAEASEALLDAVKPALHFASLRSPPRTPSTAWTPSVSVRAVREGFLAATSTPSSLRASGVADASEPASRNPADKHAATDLASFAGVLVTKGFHRK